MPKHPSVVQLPGGIRLSAVPFRVVERNEDGSPRLFAIMPPGTQVEGVRDMWTLYGDASTIRQDERE
jgi:hypothetical protein